MKDFRNKQLLIVSVWLLAMGFAFGQIKVSEFIQESKTALSDDNSLYFVDYWATWCGPCVHAKKYLASLQKQYPDDFYIVSLSEENPLTVERFLNKKPSDLAVAIDYQGENFIKNKVRSLPHGILYNAKGQKLWEGNSADLKSGTIVKHLRQNAHKTTLKSFFEVVAIEDDRDDEYIPLLPLEIESISNSPDGLKIIDSQHYLRLSGALKDIVGYLAKIYKDQIVIDNALNTSYDVYFKKPLNLKENLAFKFITELDFKVDLKMSEGEVINFNIEDPKFWDTSQINWGKNNSKYLVGDSGIKADDVSLKDMAFELSKVLEMPVIVPENSEITMSLHDWDFHYKFFELMQSDLYDNYGIQAEKKVVPYRVYHIIKKVP